MARMADDEFRALLGYYPMGGKFEVAQVDQEGALAIFNAEGEYEFLLERSELQALVRFLTRYLWETDDVLAKPCMAGCPVCEALQDMEQAGPDLCGCCHHVGHKGSCDLHCPSCVAGHGL
jgi:hypothetical protein